MDRSVDGRRFSEFRIELVLLREVNELKTFHLYALFIICLIFLFSFLSSMINYKSELINHSIQSGCSDSENYDD